ncbi:helix-turn-helix domain-containing protein [Mucilaginibacter sp. HD30]
MDVICIEESAFHVLVEKVVARIREKTPAKSEKWISGAEAMQLLRLKSKTTLQKMKDEGKIRVSQPAKRIILYDRDSISDYLEDFAYETFDMP